MSEPVTVLKLNVQREETWRYSGEILRRWPNAVLLQGFFNRDDSDFHGMSFLRNDRIIEIFYSDRWYNIFEVHDRGDDRLKGWYCNITLPAEFNDDTVTYVDLALDLLVFPDGRQLVLDEDEFDALQLDEATRQKALAALVDLQQVMHSPPVLSKYLA